MQKLQSVCLVGVQLRMLIKCDRYQCGGEEPESPMNGQQQATQMNPSHEINISPPFA